MKHRWLRRLALALACAVLAGGALAEELEPGAPDPVEIIAEPWEEAVEESGEFALEPESEDVEAPAEDPLAIDRLPLDPEDAEALANALGSARIVLQWTRDGAAVDNPGDGADGLYTFTLTGPDGFARSAQFEVIGGAAQPVQLNDLPVGDYALTVQTDSLPAGVTCAAIEGGGALEASHIPEEPLTWRVIFDVAAPEVAQPVETAVELAVGEQYAIDAALLLPDGGPYGFETEDRRVLRVTASGVVHALRQGQTAVLVTGPDGAQARVNITVVKAPKRVTLNKTRLTLGAGQAYQLTATVSPADSAADVIFSSSAPDVARMDADGRVTGLAPGSATITATTRNGRRAVCRVTVKPAPQTMTLNRTNLDMNAGTVWQLRLTCEPSDAWAGAKYESSDAAVASVNASGRVTARKPGSAVITATGWNGLTASCAVTVWEAPAKISLDAATRTLGVGQTFTLNAKVESASGKPAVRWTTSSARVATVSGGEVTAKGVGEATITARTADGQYASCAVTVKRAPDSIKVEARRVSMGIGGVTFVRAILPAGTYTDITWTVEGDAVTLDDEGRVTGVAEGAAFIYATAHNGVSGYAMIDVSSEEETGRLSGIRIGIDPGHQRKGNNGLENSAPWGGTMKAKVSSGTSGVSTRVPEYVVVLEVGLKLRDTLEAMGAEVYMTRTTHDVDISNQERAKLLNSYNVDLALRLHCDGMNNYALQGIGLYTSQSAPSAAESLRAAKALMPQMRAATGAAERGIYQTDKYTGNNWSTVPCVLVELGYLTNPAEDKKLNDPAYQQLLANGMAEGICDFVGR